MRTTKTMTVSLPPALLRQFEEVRKIESRTRSELVREALREYVKARYPLAVSTTRERAALRRGRAAFQKGDAVSLRAFLHDVERQNNRSRAKGLSKATA